MLGPGSLPPYKILENKLNLMAVYSMGDKEKPVAVAANT